MKYFSLSYSLSKEDYSEYSKLGIKALTVTRLKKIIFPLIFFIGMGLFYEEGSFLFIPVLFVVNFAVPIMVDREYVNALYKKSNLIRKTLTVDFYSDHFVLSTQPDVFSKCSSEKHFGFDTVVAVNETAGYFYFIFRTNNILIIPKSALSPEHFGMIRNLIDNLFSKVYRSV